MPGLILALSTVLKLLPSVGLVRFEKLPGCRGGLVLFPPGTGEGLQAPGTAVLALVPWAALPTQGLAGPPLIFDVNVISTCLLTVLFIAQELKRSPQAGSEHESDTLRP